MPRLQMCQTVLRFQSVLPVKGMQYILTSLSCVHWLVPIVSQLNLCVNSSGVTYLT